MSLGETGTGFLSDTERHGRGGVADHVLSICDSLQKALPPPGVTRVDTRCRIAASHDSEPQRRPLKYTGPLGPRGAGTDVGQLV